jgi:hypothetical protein
VPAGPADEPPVEVRESVGDAARGILPQVSGEPLPLVNLADLAVPPA